MRRIRQGNDTEASLSFLDVIACAFGAIVLLVLVLPVGQRSDPEPGVDLSEYGALLLLLAERQQAAAALEDQLAANRERADGLNELLSARRDASDALRAVVAQTRADTDAVRARIADIQQTQAAVSAAARRQPTESKPTDYAGIPVDSEYVAIVVDTSGSMQGIWAKVVGEIDNVLSIYPAMRGFQILSASGGYLWKPGVWIDDNPGNRGVAKAKLPYWSAYSASNPEDGILTAVRDLYRPAIKMAIFVFGDDYVGTDYDNFLEAVRIGVDRQTSATGRLRIHAFGFLSGVASQRAEYATLMRELTRRHDGAFLALSR